MPHETTMPAVGAFVTAGPCAPLPRVAPAGPAALAVQSVAPIAVERVSGTRLTEIETDWLALNGRAHEPNVFMDPAAIQVAERHCWPGQSVTLLAWRQADDRPTLVGLWAFSVGSPPQSLLPVRVLQAPPVPHAYLATPVLDRAAAEDALKAMLDFIARDPTLPKTIALDPVAVEGPTMQALMRVLRARGSRPCIMARGERPVLASDLDAKAYFERALSSSSRKKLRQHRRRLEEKGVLSVTLCNTAPSVASGFDEFLALEAAGWKGRRGSAMLCSDTDAAFAREMISALARRGDAVIYALHLDGKPVSVQVVLRAGAVAYTWKTAYEEAFSDFSPGMLLLEEYTKSLLADDAIALVDSCAYDTSGFMSAWTERQAMAQVWFDARNGGTLGFLMLSRLRKVSLFLRAAVKDAYLSGRRLWKTW